jgi:DNA-binding transcriptional MerR regulator
MRLKTSYTAREVAPLTGLTARQLQWWDTHQIFQSAIAPRRTTSGGFTERRYSPVDLLELLALAELRRRGFQPAELKQLLDALRDYFRRRLSETLDDAGELRLLTDGKGLFLRTRQGHIFDMLADPTQPLVTGDGLPLEPVIGRARAKKKTTTTKT